MTDKWERRQRKQDKARYGMKMSGKSIKSLPTGASFEYSHTIKGVGEYRVTARSREQAVRLIRRRVPRHRKYFVTVHNVQEGR